MNTQLDLLWGLPPSKADEVLELGTRVMVPSGGELFALGANAENIYVIQRGRIRLTLPMQVRGAQEDILVEERLPGQTVGWSALIPPYRFTLKATAPLETEVISFSRETLTKYFAIHPDIGYSVTQNLAAVIGQRLQLFQTMWLREMQRVVDMACT